MFYKVTVTEALWQQDTNHDGDMLDNVRESDIGVDTNGDGDTDDDVGYWDDNGSVSANDNTGYPPPP